MHLPFKWKLKSLYVVSTWFFFISLTNLLFHMGFFIFSLKWSMCKLKHYKREKMPVDVYNKAALDFYTGRAVVQLVRTAVKHSDSLEKLHVYSVTFMGCLFIIWYTQTACMHITLWVGSLWGPTRWCFLVSFPELVLNSCGADADPCPSDQAATPHVETPHASAAVWHRPAATWVVGILDIVFLHRNSSQHRGAISAASGSQQSLSQDEESLLSSSLPTTGLSQNLDPTFTKQPSKDPAESFSVYLQCITRSFLQSKTAQGQAQYIKIITEFFSV